MFSNGALPAGCGEQLISLAIDKIVQGFQWVPLAHNVPRCNPFLAIKIILREERCILYMEQCFSIIPWLHLFLFFYLCLYLYLFHLHMNLRSFYWRSYAFHLLQSVWSLFDDIHWPSGIEKKHCRFLNRNWALHSPLRFAF